MNKNYICKELIKVANQLDIEGDYDLANDITKTAYNMANVREAQLGRSLFNLFKSRLMRKNYMQMAQQSGNPAFIQEATMLQQEEQVFNQKKKAFIDKLTAASTPQVAQSAVPAAQIQGTIPQVSQVNPQVSQQTVGRSQPSMGNNQLAAPTSSNIGFNPNARL